MSRIFTKRNTPKPNEKGEWIKGIPGTAKEQAMLAISGFTRAEAANGDVYYTGHDRMIWLFSDGTFTADKGGVFRSTLEEYVGHLTTAA